MSWFMKSATISASPTTTSKPSKRAWTEGKQACELTALVTAALSPLKRGRSRKDLDLPLHRLSDDHGFGVPGEYSGGGLGLQIAARRARAISQDHGRSEEHTSELQSRQYLVC